MSRSPIGRFLRSLRLAARAFFREDGIDKASILAYYSIFSTLFLLTFATFVFARILGDPDTAIKSIYPFSQDFFTRISPELFARARNLSGKLQEIGVIGVSLFVFLGFLLLKKVVQYINEMCHTHLRYRGFWVRRMSEFGLVLFTGILVALSSLSYAMAAAMRGALEKTTFLSGIIHPQVIDRLNTFLLTWLTPSLLTFLFFLVLYKWVPEKKVHTRSALYAALFCTVLWESVKRLYAWYLIDYSVWSRIHGPVVAIILFGFWMELSMGIMLYGAKLTYILDRRHHEPST